jgi:hypothetical protein
VVVHTKVVNNMVHLSLMLLSGLLSLSQAAFTIPNDDQDMSGLVVNGIQPEKRIEYMRKVATHDPYQVHY